MKKTGDVKKKILKKMADTFTHVRFPPPSLFSIRLSSACPPSLHPARGGEEREGWGWRGKLRARAHARAHANAFMHHYVI